MQAVQISKIIDQEHYLAQMAILLMKFILWGGLPLNGLLRIHGGGIGGSMVMPISIRIQIMTAS